MPPLTDGAWQTARARWAEIATNSPDLTSAVLLQQRLLTLMFEAAQSLERGDADEPLLSSDALAAKWILGVPALRNVTIPLPANLAGILPPLCEALVESGAGDSARHLRDAIDQGRVDPGSLLRVSLARNEKAMRTSALHMGFAPDLVWLVGELGSSPLAYHLQTRLGSQAGVEAALKEWDRGYCPWCGSWPVLIEVVSGARTLRCSFCAAGWELASRRCVYCQESGPDLVSAAPDPAMPGRRVDLCGKCGSYTKVVEVAAPTPFPLLALEDLASLDLDRGAMNRGYARPRLFNLDLLAPLSTDCA